MELYLDISYGPEIMLQDGEILAIINISVLHLRHTTLPLGMSREQQYMFVIQPLYQEEVFNYV